MQYIHIQHQFPVPPRSPRKFGFGGICLLVTLMIFVIQQGCAAVNTQPNWILGCVWFTLAVVCGVIGVWFWKYTADRHWAVKTILSVVLVGLFSLFTYAPVRDQYMREHATKAQVLTSNTVQAKRLVPVPDPHQPGAAVDHQRTYKPRARSKRINPGASQRMSNSPHSIQQYSAGANSPNIVGNGNLVGNTFNIDTHTAPPLTETLQNQLSLALAPYAGSKVMLFIHRGNQSTRAFAEALTAAMQKDSIEVVSMGEGNQLPEPPPGISCLVSENRMALAGTLANFLVNNHLLPTNKLPAKTALQPDRMDCTIAPW